MSGHFTSAIEAAGVAAFSINTHVARFSGPYGNFGLLSDTYKLDDLIVMLAPGDRDAFAKAVVLGELDMRVRLVGEEGEVRYIRFLGKRENADEVSGLMIPAGGAGFEARRQLDAENRVTDAVLDGEILAYYQPIVALEDNRLAGFEALARWDRPGEGILSPDDFLPLAESLDLLGDIGDTVRITAAKDIAAWRAARPDSPLFVTANSSVSELVSEGFADRLIAAVELAGLRAGTYKLEIAETEIMKDPDRATKVIATLREAGIQIALDDFGTGYSSLSRLEAFTFDTVKIDRYFIRAMETSDSAIKVVESVIQLARHMGMTVVAEGIETPEAMKALRDMGCDYGQGFRFAGALPAETASEVVAFGLTDRIGAP